MTFNNSCFLTVLANLLEEYNIDIWDRGIVLDSMIPYIFQYDNLDNNYQAGYQIQDIKCINLYLQRYSLIFKESRFFEDIFSSNDIFFDFL